MGVQRSVFCGALLLIAAGVAMGQGSSEVNRIISAEQTPSKPSIDGLLEDPIWQTATKHRDFYDRRNGGLIADQTEFAIVYDDTHIYVAFWVSEPNPEKIVGKETVENSRFSGNQESEDYVDIRFDPFRTATEGGITTFSVNPLGTRSVRFGAGRAAKKEWQGDWVAAAKKNEKGWTAEMAIPWQMLNYPRNKEGIEMGINVFRYQFHTNLQSCWSNVGPEFFTDRQGYWRGVKPPVPPSPKVSLLPYVLLGADEKETRSEVGLDARYPITSEMTAVATFNPDFGTIEGAVEGIGFTRTERFLGEKRPFFLEGSQYFLLGEEFEFGQMFYGLRIPDVDFGAKIFGKVTPKDSVGALYTMSDGDTHDAIFKYERQYNALGSVQLFGGVRDHPDDQNQVFAGKIRERFGRSTFTLYGASSSGNGQQGTAYQATYWYSQQPHFIFFSYRDISPDFRPANGFVRQRGVRGPNLYYEYDQQPKTGPWKSLGVDFDAATLDKTDGGRYEDGVSANVFGTLRESDLRISLSGYSGMFENERDEFLSLTLRKGSSRFMQYGLQYQAGILSDDPFEVVAPFFSYRIGKGLDIAYQGVWFQFRGDTEQHVMTLNYELSPTRAIGGRMVMEDDDWNGYLSYRHSGKKGTETFIILGDPNARTFQKVLQIKFVFAL